MALLLYLFTCIQGRYRSEVKGLFNIQSLVGTDGHLLMEIEFCLLTIGKIEMFYLHFKYIFHVFSFEMYRYLIFICVVGNL